MIPEMLSRFRRVALGAVSVLALGATAAQADFRGGGSVFSMTSACSAVGLGSQAAYPVSVRYFPSELVGQPPSQITLAFVSGTEHFSLWGPMAPSGGQFLGAAGRQIRMRFVFYSNSPRLNIVRREITQRVNPSGPDTIPNARELVLRVRIQNYSNVPGCAVTMSATLRRI